MLRSKKSVRRHPNHRRRHYQNEDNSNLSVVAAATMAVTAACFLSCVTSPYPTVDAFSTYNNLVPPPSINRGILDQGGATSTQLITPKTRRNTNIQKTTTSLNGKLWDKLQIEEDDPPTPDLPLSWYVINCVAGVELELLRQCRETCSSLPPTDVEKFIVPTRRTMRSHGQRNVVDVKVLYPGYVFCKIRMCPETYEPLQALALTRSWISGTVNRRGYKKLPPAPVALNEDEVEKFGLLESQMEEYEKVHGLEGTGDTGEDLIEQYKGFEVEGMVKVLSGKHKGEDGVVRRLKDGKICIRMYTYGTTFDEWFAPEELRPMTDLEIMRGLSGPTSPVFQDEFDVSIGKPVNRGRFDGEKSGGGRGNRHVRQSLIGQGGGGGEGRRMRRQDRVSRGERGERDLFGRSDEEAKREEENWRDYREKQRAAQREGRRGGSWGIKERSSWGGGDDGFDNNRGRAAYDVDSQWGRGDRRTERADIRSGRQRRRDARREADRREFEDDGVERALSGEGDWSDFASGSGGGGASSSKEDDFFDSLMSELSDSLDGSGSSSSSSSPSAGTEGATATPGGGRGGNAPQSDEDDFFNSLMSDIGDTVDTPPPSNQEKASGGGSSDEDDFFASLESELSSTLDNTPASSSPKKTSEPAASNDEDDFFASLESELSNTLDTPAASSSTPRKTSESTASSSSGNNDAEDDFFASLESELSDSLGKSGAGGGGDDVFNEDDFFASLEAEVASAANEPSSATSSSAAASKPKKKKVSAAKASSGSGGGGGGEDLAKLTVPLLKERLKERGLKVSGRKAELIERLQSAGC